jgi:hypothetical protein
VSRPSVSDFRTLEAITASGELEMSSRALSLATVMLLVGCFAAIPVQAQNLEAGKSPSQIFAGTCSLCHKTSRGLLKTVPPGTLPGFLREHYTTSSDMASLLSAFLISNGANDTRFGGSQSKQGKDAKPEVNPASLSEQVDRPGRRPRSVAVPQEDLRPDVGLREVARPDADDLPPQRQGRNAKRPPRPGEVPDTANVSERDFDGPKSASKQKLTKRGRPGGEEAPKTDAAKTDAAKTDAAKTEPAKDEPSKGETAKDEQPKNEAVREREVGSKTEGAKAEGSKTEGTKPSGEGKSEAAKIDVPKETGSTGTPALRADPVPPVTPAPPAASLAASNGMSGPTTAAPSAPVTPSAPSAVAASAPQPAPVVPTGPPVPPISQ